MAKSQFRTLSNEHACAAMTQYLKALSMIEDNEEVTAVFKAPGNVEMKVEVKNV